MTIFSIFYISASIFFKIWIIVTLKLLFRALVSVLCLAVSQWLHSLLIIDQVFFFFFKFSMKSCRGFLLRNFPLKIFGIFFFIITIVADLLLFVGHNFSFYNVVFIKISQPW